jgi:hypothetical protein
VHFFLFFLGDTCCVVFHKREETLKCVFQKFNNMQDRALAGFDDDIDHLEMKSGEILKNNIDSTCDIIWNSNCRGTEYLNAKWFAAIERPNEKAGNYMRNRKRGVSGDYIVYLGGDEKDAADGILKSYLRKTMNAWFKTGSYLAGSVHAQMKFVSTKSRKFSRGLTQIVPGSLNFIRRKSSSVKKRLHIGQEKENMAPNEQKVK